MEPPADTSTCLLAIGWPPFDAVMVRPQVPPLGSSSLGLRLVSDSWSASGDAESLEFAGAAGVRYELAVWNPGQIASVEGGEIKNGKLGVNIPSSSSETYSRRKVVIHFVATR